MPNQATTLLDKLWDPHVVADLGEGWSLLHIDRVLLHDLSGARALNEIAEKGHPGRAAGTGLRHAGPRRVLGPGPHLGDLRGRRAADRRGCGSGRGKRASGCSTWASRGHGIVHVMAPELGVVLPGLTLVCGDSHTCTNGGVGALAFGIGASELTHVLATQTLMQRKPGRCASASRARCRAASPPRT
jgi:3-isopropylmalate/(R)-2-methylmalate dehydratase large subunit